VQYVDYALWQREWLRGEVLEKQLEYWRKKLEGAAVLELPGDRRRRQVPSYGGGMVSFEIEEESRRGLEKLGRESGATLYMVLLAGLGAVLERWSGQRDV